MTKLLMSTLLAAAVLASLQVSAAAPEQNYYVGLTAAKGGTLTYRNPANGKTDSEDAGAIFKVYGGFALTDYVALEGGYSQGGKARFDRAVLNMAFDPTFQAKNFYLAGRATHHFNDDWSVFGKLGVTHNRYEGAAGPGTVTSTKPLLGVGMAYNVTREVALTLEYENMGRTRKGGVNVKHNALQLGVKVGF